MFSQNCLSRAIQTKQVASRMNTSEWMYCCVEGDVCSLGKCHFEDHLQILHSNDRQNGSSIYADLFPRAFLIN